MNYINLRKLTRVSYYEPEEPDLDEYIFCTECADFVYEYCAIHGPLLVIPDNKVIKHKCPPSVPRAALTVPDVFLHLAPSRIPGAGTGVFSSLALPCGVRFGPYLGERVDKHSNYSWQIYDKNGKPSHIVDARDADTSNWMRYVNCARHWHEQNLVAFQYQGKMYYRTIRIIPRDTELLVFYGREFASKLNIDLVRYNAPAGYAHKLGAPLLKKPNFDINIRKQVKIRNNTIQETVTKRKNIVSNVENHIHKENRTTNVSIKSSREKKSNKTDERKKNVNICNYKETATEKPTLFTNDVYYSCDKCNYKTGDRDGVEKHKRFHDETRRFVCSVCNHRFVNKKGLTSHARIHTKTKKKISCDICSYKGSVKSHLITHLRTHTGEKPYSCDICSYKGSVKSNLITHLRTHTGEKPYSCDICSYKFSVYSSLLRHLRTHTGEKPYSCDICSYKSSEKINLIRHLRTHTGEKPYCCDICSYKCSQKINLIRHLRTHTGEKPYSCDICSYKSSEKRNLIIHLRTHTGEKPYCCDICSYKGSVKCHLITHLRTHTGEKPYCCDICSYKGSVKSHLITHLRTHTGEKPYSCDICSYKCSVKTNLLLHLRTHTGEKPYCCDICSYKCSQKGSLKTHLKRH